MATGTEVNFLFYVMFWTILAMMLVLLYALKQVVVTQRHIRNIDGHVERLAEKILNDEEEILKKLSSKRTKRN